LGLKAQGSNVLLDCSALHRAFNFLVFHENMGRKDERPDDEHVGMEA